MNQLKKINKIFNETLEPTLLNNKVKLNKSAFFNYVIEKSPKPTVTQFSKCYTQCTESVIHWLHIKHFIDKNNQNMVNDIYDALKEFLEKYHKI